ncbi:ApeP family dehydratase [Larsenimonas suaedae]|uniref:3-hydroxylacyl-ACP dehydratase n=1 Tax=Larsenimonas suaedae TaxID=1851019 RepID=A0ABU1GY49_9GAMM|nr:hypothetical protein [Larsenimonas suaedae]MCM2973059.1 hypothetical protein [Larsenimonas suaedae]MDR5896496.1 hypothetical protein [Larsenimonas suaedae]
MTGFPRPIAECVPHQGPMCLLDQVEAASAETLTARVTPTPGALFADEVGIDACVGLEWIAQAIAAWGYLTAEEAGTPKKGLLLGAKRYQPSVTHFEYGRTYRVTIEPEFVADNGLGTFNGAIWLDDTCVAQGNLRIFQPDNPEALTA